MTTELNKSELFRLAAVLYADNNYEVSNKVIQRKVLDSALLDCNNQDLSFHQIIDYIENKYSLIISEDEINKVITKYPESFLINKNGITTTICLSPKRKTILETKIEKNNIDYYIDEFSAKKIDKEYIKNTIYNFLYHMFSVNTSSFQKLIDKEKDISNLISIQDSNYSNKQIDIINKFLNWDNEGKNKAIFDISSYALEFCLLTNKKGNSNLKLDNLKNKSFYLDTNIIYRAIGINGGDRKKRTSTFLIKFKEAKENLYISKITDEEFKNSIRFYVDKLKKVINPKISSSVFLEYRSLKDIHSFYHKWRKEKINANFELFEAHIMSEYMAFIENFNIELDYKTPYDLDNKETAEYINDLVSSINKYKSEEKKSYFHSTFNDAENIIWIENKRNNKIESIFDTKYFFISSDNQLRKWDYYRGFKTPIVLLPSQWMSILLRYFDRTNNDFKSFVSFLNLRNNEKIIEGEKLNLVLSGISEMTTDVKQQRFLISNLVEKDFESIISNNLTDEEIIERSKQYAKTELEKQVSLLSKKVEKLEKETTKKEEKFEAVIKTAKNKKEINLELESEISNEKKSNKKLYEENINLKIANGIYKWRKILWLYIPLTLILIIIYYYALFYDDSDFNIGKKLLKNIDARTSDSTKTILNSLFYLPCAAAGWMIWQSINKFNNEKVDAKKKALREKFEKESK